MYRRDDEKLQCRDGDQAGHFSGPGRPVQYRTGIIVLFDYGVHITAFRL